MSTHVPIAALRGSGVPVQQAARVPQAVREGSPAAKQAYSSAQGFEQLLVSQLSQSLLASSGLEGGEEEAAGAEGSQGGGAISSLLSQALSEGVMQGGGLGLSRQLAASATQGTDGAPGAAAAGTTPSAATVGTAGGATPAVGAASGGTAA